VIQHHLGQRRPPDDRHTHDSIITHDELECHRRPDPGTRAAPQVERCHDRGIGLAVVQTQC
jgi:hypothetical protein